MSDQIKTLTLKQVHLGKLFDWLSMPLVATEARNRKRFLSVIQPLFNEGDTERVDILKKYADKKEDGSFDLILKGTSENYQFTNLKDDKKKEDDFVKELEDQQNATVSIDILPSIEGSIQTVYGLLKDKLEVKFDNKTVEGVQAEIIYDQVMEAFEKVCPPTSQE